MSYLTPSNQLQEALLQFQEAFKHQDVNTRLKGIKRLVLSLNEVTHIEDFFEQEAEDEDKNVAVAEELLTLSHIFQTQAEGYLTGWVNSGQVSEKVREYYSGLWNKLSHQTRFHWSLPGNTIDHVTYSKKNNPLVKYLFVNRYCIKGSVDKTLSSVPNEACKKKIASVLRNVVKKDKAMHIQRLFCGTGEECDESDRFNYVESYITVHSAFSDLLKDQVLSEMTPDDMFEILGGSTSRPSSTLKDIFQSISTDVIGSSTIKVTDSLTFWSKSFKVSKTISISILYQGSRS